MALFKLFTKTRRNDTNFQDSSEKLFAFNSDQVRIILFRECDFRGRKLLFDSSNSEKNEEIHNGYTFPKPGSDFSELSEMVFGSVAMSFRGTLSKIHNLAAPARLMFSQVFPSPRSNRPSHCSANTSSQSLFEHSKLMDVYESDDVYSENSLVSIRPAHLDVPKINDTLNSIVADSGYENSGSDSTWDSGTTCGFSSSSGSFSKHWLRRHSLDVFGQNNSFLPPDTKCFSRSKLGLVLVVELTPGQDKALSGFLMEHVTLLEMLLWRMRNMCQVAYLKPTNFMSSMLNVAAVSKQYLVNLLSGSILSTHFWLSSSTLHGCDNNTNSIGAFNSAADANKSDLIKDNKNTKKLFVSNSFNNVFSLGNYNYNYNYSSLDHQTDKGDKFLREFCQLLETIDVKDTNFFMSTLVTAVLTHHLGWVGTCMPPTPTDTPFNPLWSQLSDLYGAVGHPTKTAQTIITGTSKMVLMNKILTSLTYFIRCCDIERLNIVRKDVNEENKLVETICHKSECIPKENYKKYEDHLREIMNNNNIKYIFNEKKMTKNKTCRHHLSQLDESQAPSSSTSQDCDNKVIFILGDDDKLVDLEPKRPTSFLDLGDDFKDSDFIAVEDHQSLVKPSTSWSEQDIVSYPENKKRDFRSPLLINQKYSRSQSVPPEDRKLGQETTEKKSKYRYSGVKFTLQQYPQILSNYMKSKNLEMSNLQFGEKGLKFDMEITTNCIKFEGDFDADSLDALQTPSNASEELEFTSDLYVAPPPIVQHAKESKAEVLSANFVKRHIPNTVVIKEGGKRNRRISSSDSSKMKIVSLPMPKSVIDKSRQKNTVCYTCSLIRPLASDYCPDLVLQGITSPQQNWEMQLKTDLALASQHPALIDQPIEEAVAIIANIDTWQVELMSSHTYVTDRGGSGVRVGMSQLVANMLESLLQLWKLNVPTHYCLMHIEQMLQELCTRSKAVAQLLLASEFCSMELLTSTLHLEMNDVPLLLAVASTHSPQVTQKYGLSFQ